MIQCFTCWLSLANAASFVALLCGKFQVLPSALHAVRFSDTSEIRLDAGFLQMEFLECSTPPSAPLHIQGRMVNLIYTREYDIVDDENHGSESPKR